MEAKRNDTFGNISEIFRKFHFEIFHRKDIAEHYVEHAKRANAAERAFDHVLVNTARHDRSHVWILRLYVLQQSYDRADRDDESFC